jgi:VanZ family protein
MTAYTATPLSANTRRFGIVLAVGTILIALAATQYPFNYQLTEFAIHRRWDRIDWRWWPRTPMGRVRIDRDLLLNLLMLVPLGVGYGLWRRTHGLRVALEALLLGIATSTTLEVLQLITPYRYTTFADVWRNALGCMVGAIFVVLAYRKHATMAR